MCHQTHTHTHTHMLGVQPGRCQKTTRGGGRGTATSIRRRYTRQCVQRQRGRVFDKAAEIKKRMEGKRSFSPAAASSGRSSGSPPHCGCSGWGAPGSAAPALGQGRSEEEEQDEVTRH